jgi:hypothetical protein
MTTTQTREAAGTEPVLRGRRQWPWFESAAGAICAAWAFAAWLTVIPNQDMLVDGVQVQRLLQDPQIVLAFPGQKHGGVLEYPYLLLSEALAPGNTYAHTALRIVFAFLTGFLVARLFVRLFAGFPRWALLGIIAVGPSAIHGLSGPPGNPVGVWWLIANYDMSWLLVLGGAVVLCGPRGAGPVPPSALRAAVAGLLIGLGVYEQPTILVLAVPLGVLVHLRHPAALPRILWVGAGIALGMIPLAISYFVYAGVTTTWDPSHFPVFDPDVAQAVLGLDPASSYETRLLPLALGFTTTPDVLGTTGQALVVLVILVTSLIVGAIGAWRAVREHRWPAPGVAIALTWLAVAAALVVFSTMLTPIWLYATGLAVILWLSIGALPGVLPWRRVGTALAALVIALVAVSTVAHNHYWYSQVPDRVSAKADYMRTQRMLALALENAGVTMLYGSYYDVIPIGYASGSRLRFVTSTYNRFRLSPEELEPERLVVAVNARPPEAWGQEALAAVQEQCAPAGPTVTFEDYAYAVVSCPRAFFMSL